MVNRVEISGRLSVDPQTVNEHGIDWWKATVVTSVQRYDSEARTEVVKPVFVNVVAKGPVAVECFGIRKGDEVYVLGEIDQYKKQGREGPSTRVQAIVIRLVSEGRASRQGAHPAPQQGQAEGQGDPWR